MSLRDKNLCLHCVVATELQERLDAGEDPLRLFTHLVDATGDLIACMTEEHRRMALAQSAPRLANRVAGTLAALADGSAIGVRHLDKTRLN